MKKITEKGYRKLSLELIEIAVEKGEYWLASSGFINADDTITANDSQGMGYWEIVYASIASNFDDYMGENSPRRNIH
jgi:hypothetical protein|tara:strand:+ start:442 stop:672 length:231 start_codon:yes stop_codon:yes gene_type:complete